MKVKLEKTKPAFAPHFKPNKQLNITIFFRDRFSLMMIFQTIVRCVHLGTQYKSAEIKNDFFEYDLKYSENYHYEEKIIDGKVSHVYTSKL